MFLMYMNKTVSSESSRKYHPSVVRLTVGPLTASPKQSFECEYVKAFMCVCVWGGGGVNGGLCVMGVCVWPYVCLCEDGGGI